MIPMFEVQVGENLPLLLLLQEIVDQGEGVGVVLRLRVEVPVVHDQSPLSCHLFETTKQRRPTRWSTALSTLVLQTP